MMQRRLGRMLLGIALMGMLAGCGGNREASLPGTWKINADKMNLPGGNSGNAVQQMGANVARGMMANMTLELKGDKTFTMNMMFPMEGSWSFDGASSKVSLKMTKIAGTDISKMPNANAANQKPMVLTLSGDGRQLTMENPSGKPSPMGEMVFEKQ